MFLSGKIISILAPPAGEASKETDPLIVISCSLGITGGYIDTSSTRFVGNIKKINEDLISTLVAKNYLPVITCLGIDSKGKVFNINADTLATEIALKLKVNKLIFATNVKGVLESKNQKYIYN